MATNNPYEFINDTNTNLSTANVISVQPNANNTKTVVATYTDPVLYAQPQLNIINDPGGSGGQIQFNSGKGFAGDSNLTYQSNIAKLSLRGNLYVSGNVFGNIQTNLNNFHLTGGANGYVLSTDGAGNVTWISPNPNVSGSIYNGNSNVIVNANGNITFSSAGVANVVVISNDGLNLTSPNRLNLGGGNATNYLATDGAGNLYWADDIPVYIGNSAPDLPQGHLWFDSDEGRAYLNYDGNSWVDFSPAVMPNPDMFANTITFPDGSVQTTAGGGGGNNPFNQNLNTTNNVTFASVTATTGNLAQINGINPGGELVIQTGGSKNWSYRNSGILSLPFDNYLETTDIDLKAGSQGNVTIRANAATGANLQSWIFDKTGNVTFPDSTKQRTAFTGSIAGANVTGTVSSATTAGTVTTAAQPNITSTGTLSSLSVTGNVNSSANIHAAFFIGNGSQLTGITVATVGTLSSLSVTGNTRTGNLIVTANTESISPSTGSIQTAGGIGAQGNIIGNHHLYIGPGASLTAFTNPVMIGKNTGEEYVQSAIINSAETGSSDWVAYGDNGTESGGWADFGFTSSNFSDPAYTVTGSNDGYFFVQAAAGSYGGNLVIATGDNGTTNDIIFATGGFQTANIFGRISHSNLTLELPTGNISIGGNITANNLGNISGIDIDGNTSNILYGNGIFAAAPSTTYGNSNVASFLGAYGSNTISTTGSISANTITLSGTGTSVNAGSGNILTNEVTGTKFKFLNGLYTATLTGQGATSNYSLALPANAGTNGQLLTSDGTGNLTWTTSSSYGDSNVATLLGSFGSNNVSTTGNITSDSLSGSNLFVTYSSGDEGGQISLAQAANSTLDGNTVTVDIYQNRFRIFEQGGNARGVYIDLLQSASSSTTLLNNRLTSAFNTTSNEVTMDSIKVGINGSAIPYVKTVSGSTTFTWTSVFVKYDGISQYVSSGGGGTGITVSTSEQAVGTAFTTAGDSGVVTFMNQSNGQVHRVTYLAGPSNVGTGGGSVIVERLM